MRMQWIPDALFSPVRPAPPFAPPPEHLGPRLHMSMLILIENTFLQQKMVKNSLVVLCCQKVPSPMMKPILPGSCTDNFALISFWIMSANPLSKLSTVYTLHSSLELGSLRYSSECEKSSCLWALRVGIVATPCLHLRTRVQSRDL